MTGRSFIAVGAVLGGLGVAAGAFGAHGLAEMVTPARLETFETGVRYHLIHALALVLIGLLVDGRATVWAGYLFLAGLALFSGSLYVLVLTDTPWLGAVTPFGGVALIAGWAMLAWSAIRAQ